MAGCCVVPNNKCWAFAKRQEGWLISAVIMCLPFIILTVLVKLFLSERLQPGGHAAQNSSATRA
jgi:hypothetical protein